MKDRAVSSDKQKLDVIENLITSYGQIDGDHHKLWVINEIIKVITGDEYQQWVNVYCDGEDGPNTYGWDTGIAP